MKGEVLLHEPPAQSAQWHATRSQQKETKLIAKSSITIPDYEKCNIALGIANLLLRSKNDELERLSGAGAGGAASSPQEKFTVPAERKHHCQENDYKL